MAPDELAERIQHRIITGDYPAGTRLRQERLAAEFGVSRMPVREALQKLRAAGLIEIVPHRGAFVHGPGPDEIRQAYVVRAELEGLAAELAAQRINDRELRSMRAAAALFKSAADEVASDAGEESPRSHSTATWPRANDQFHQAILVASGNERLHQTVLALHGSFPRNLTWSVLSGSSILLRRNAAEHDAILAAIETGDQAAAREAAKLHVLRSGELVASRLGGQAAGQ